MKWKGQAIFLFILFYTSIKWKALSGWLEKYQGHRKTNIMTWPLPEVTGYVL